MAFRGLDSIGWGRIGAFMSYFVWPVGLSPENLGQMEESGPLRFVNVVLVWGDVVLELCEARQ